MNMISTAGRNPAPIGLNANILWPDPEFRNLPSALDDLSCMMERLGALHRSNTSDLHEVATSESATASAWLLARLNEIWMISTIVGEKVAEAERVIAVATEAAYQSSLHFNVNFVHAPSMTSVGRHVDIQRRSAWIEAVDAYRAAEAVPVDSDTPDTVFTAAADAFTAMVKTRAPDLRSLHEKMTIIAATDGWSATGVIHELFNDVEALARRYEIDQSVEGRGTSGLSWDELMQAYVAAQAAEDEYAANHWDPVFLPEIGSGGDLSDPAHRAINTEMERLQSVRHDLLHELLGAEAPNNAALAWKLEWLFGDRDNICWADKTVDPVVADIRRLLGGEA